MIYPLNLFTPDPITNSLRPFMMFSAKEVNFNAMRAKSWSDAKETLSTKMIFALPIPNTGIMDSFQNEYGSEPSVGGLLAQKAQDTFNALPGAAGISSASARLGFVADPKYTQLYKGSSPRSWSGTWQIVPESLGESLVAHMMLRAIKYCAAPDKKSDASNKIGVLIQPYVFSITISNPLIDRAVKFDKMVMKSYDITYYAQGYASSYKDMFPKQISLSLKFEEFGIKTRKDWGKPF